MTSIAALLRIATRTSWPTKQTDVAAALRGSTAVLSGFAAVAAAATLVIAASTAVAAPAPSSSGSSGPKEVRLEDLPGGVGKRVILTAKAAERLGIETGEVGEQTIVRKLMVGGFVIPPLESIPEQPKLAGGAFGSFGKAATTADTQPVAAPAATATTGDAWVLVSLSDGEWAKIKQDEPARIMPLQTRQSLSKDVVAQPSGNAPVEDIKRSMLTAYYMVPGQDHGLEMNTRVRVELTLKGDQKKRTVIPYGAVYYDANGATWAYVNSEPLVYERRPITVDFIVGDMAILTDGPAVGTKVVTVGAAMLFGSEIFKK